ncbi:MAG: TonB-dependent receptor [Crocinitomicaceae bacterium]|nr:TonB-dependent receptor [Crocinitomicaceae bacterium]
MKIVLLIAMTWCLQSGLAQTGNLQGVILDAKENPLDFAEVLVLNSTDSSVYSGAITLADGTFNIQNIPAGETIVKTIHADHLIKYQNISVRANETIQLEPILLSKDMSIDLEEVIAAGSLDDLKAGIDKKVYSVEQDISVRGGSANDILNNIPSIDVDQDGNVSLRGDGNVTILINGRPSALTSGNGQSLLDALPANSIERIEVVTNPSAKYDPDGTSGIINIVLKKNRKRGINGIVSGTAATGHVYDGTLGLSYRDRGTNFYLNYTFNYYEGYRNYFSDLRQQFGTDSSNYLDQDREGTHLKITNALVLGADFELDSNNTLGFSVTGSIGDRERTGLLVNRLYDQEEELFRYWTRNSFDPVRNRNGDFNINHTFRLRKGDGKWTSNATQSFSDRDIKGFYDERNYGLDGSSYELGVDQQLFNATKQRITTIQSDFEYIFEKIRGRMEAGAKAILRNVGISTYSNQYDSISNAYIPDTLSDFDYIYDEQVYSVYGIFGQQLGKFSYQGGVRGEFARQIPNLVSTGEKYDNNYVNLFPSAHVKYKPKKGIEYSLSYSRRINRARSHQLNPFASYADPFNIRRGNPALQPEYINSFDLGYSLTKKKVIFSASIFHRRTVDVINRVKLYFPNNTAVVTYDNIDKSESTGLETIFIYKPVNWFKSTLSFNGNYIDYTNTDTTVNWNNSGFNWRAKLMISVDFWKRTATLQINGNYNAPRVTPQGIVYPGPALDISFEKQLLNRKLSVGARVTDVFDTRGFSIDLEQERISQQSEYKWLTRRFYLTVSYRFGKQDVKLKKRPSSGGDGGGM